MTRLSKITLGQIGKTLWDWYVNACVFFPPVMLIIWGVGELVNRITK